MRTQTQTNSRHKPSGIDWLGDIPAGWKVRKLKYLSRIDTSGIFGDEMVGDIEAKLVTTGQLSMSGKWHWEKMENRFFTKDEYKKFKNIYGDIVVVKSSGSSTNIVSGKAGFVSEKEVGTVFGNFLLRIRASDMANSKFLYYFLTSHLTRQRIELMCSSTTYPNLKVWEYVSALLLLPPLETQKRIADFLDEKTEIIDELIEKKERLIELMHEKRAALITRAVTKGLDPKAKMKPSGIDWLGGIPAGWEIRRIRFLVQTNPSKSEISDFPNQPVSFLPMPYVSENGALDLSEERDLNFIYTGYTYFRDGDVILAKITPCFENGKGAFISDLKNGIGFGSTEFHVFRPKKIDGKFLYYFFASDGFMKFGELNMKGTAGQKRVPELFIKDFVMGIPKAKEQKQIADFLDTETAKIDKAAALTESQIEKLKEYRSSLIYHAVTGKIKV